MNLNNITNTGTWGAQVTALNQNFNLLGVGYDTLAGECSSLQDAYSGLEQGDIRPMTAAEWAQISADTSNLEEHVIYRVAGQSTTTDYMWNGTSIVTIYTYNATVLTYAIGTKTYNNY